MDQVQHEKIERYRGILRKVIEEYASHKLSHGETVTEAIIDPVRDHYEVMNVGWDKHRRIHGCVIHCDLIGDKIWIQHDGTDRPVAEELIQAGVPKEDIVLGFHSKEVRPFTEFAVG